MSEETQAQERGPDGSPPGHIERMTGRSQETPAPESEAPAPAERPDDIPEKFWDAEKGEVNVQALLKSQQDAEAALRKSQTAEDETPAEEQEEAPSAEQEAQDNVVESASAEFAEKGELSDATYASLEKVGISREMTDSYIAGQLAVVEKLRNAAYEPFDGEDNYNAAADWAAANLSESEIQALDVQLTSMNPSIVAQGAKALLDAYSKGADVEPSAIRGDSNVSTNGSVYKSRAEMMKDMASSRYRTDAGFRQEVMEKLGRSKLGR